MAPSLSLARPKIFFSLVNNVTDWVKGILALPMILRLIEYKPVIDKIPARSEGILNLVCKTPVTSPAKAPAIRANIQDNNGSIPLTILEAQTAAPKVNDPSLVKSEIFKKR